MKTKEIIEALEKSGGKYHFIFKDKDGIETYSSNLNSGELMFNAEFMLHIARETVKKQYEERVIGFIKNGNFTKK